MIQRLTFSMLRLPSLLMNSAIYLSIFSAFSSETTKLYPKLSRVSQQLVAGSRQNTPALTPLETRR